MPSFADLERRVESLRSFCRLSIGSSEIHEISTDPPESPLDELFFRKLVAWCYVLLFETGPFFRFSAKLIRTDREVQDRFVSFRRFIECARTVHAHNLLLDKKNDVEKRRGYDIWLATSGGDEPNWRDCCNALMNEADRVLADIELAWTRRSDDDADHAALWREYDLQKKMNWEAFEFDLFVGRAAAELRLAGLDASAFRKGENRVDRWRKLVELFDSRAEAEVAIARAIHAELISVFGESS